MLFLVVVVGAFGLGQRSVVKRDKAYYLTRDARAYLSHEWRMLVGAFRLRKESDIEEGKETIVQSNDFEVHLVMLTTLGNTEKTAGFVRNGDGMLQKFEQLHVFDLWKRYRVSEFLPDAEPTTVHGGGLKQVMSYEGSLIGLVSMKADECFFAALINFDQRAELFRSPCIPNNDFVDFNSLGGAHVVEDDGILMSLGSPASDEQTISNLAQDPSSPYGKILRFDKARLQGVVAEKSAFEIHSRGHRNPQGMVRMGDKIYAVDHGPKGGDKINRIQPDKNYGWPLYSLGSRYSGQPYPTAGDPALFEPALFSFVPSLAPSDIAACPEPLASRYAPFQCVLITTLRGTSLLIALIDGQDRVVSIEQLQVDMRLREFVQLEDGLAVSTDGEGVYRLLFKEDFSRY
ncbi:PQQ-dependent sugar dehydrogenase [Hydrogenophaga sp.]|uniref:PQQ-dependent sugar dehydrogenase n=1 Tax=Hydrogenophaga sp. TaxID=1904254 RepID=UPI0027251F4C|nr:PQQ-dependent sugar dehydrogenase [Hydrogenophaga sp.]MDO8904850.1 PQQ-dependent sugar dehydrogenase [Hydrogenophaga sp.]